MEASRFRRITERYPHLKIGVVGDFCLDRYLEIDPGLRETSIETDLPVHNVVRVRSQPGAAGTILNNLVALGVGTIQAVGFCGEDGEGFELRQALGRMQGVRCDHFLQTRERRTFTYCKPLLVQPGKPPRELNRLDSKNWTPTPSAIEDRLAESLRRLAREVDGIILMDQVDAADTGVVTRRLLEVVGELARARPELPILADSRRGLAGYPPIVFKMNRAELEKLAGQAVVNLDQVKEAALGLARRNGRQVFVTLSENGVLGATPDGEVVRVPSLPVEGEIDVVGAGDSVTANLMSSLAAGATARESMQIAMGAAAIVIRQLGTTGTANPEQIASVLGLSRRVR